MDLLPVNRYIFPSSAIRYPLMACVGNCPASIRADNRDCRLFPHAVRLRSGLSHADTADGAYLIALCGLGIALDRACHDPAKVDNLRSSKDPFLRFCKGIHRKSGFLRQQSGITLCAAAFSSRTKGIKPTVFSLQVPSYRLPVLSATGFNLGNELLNMCIQQGGNGIFILRTVVDAVE